jgi:hypothetical protein
LLENNRISLEFKVEDTVNDGSIQREADDDRFPNEEFPRSDQRYFEDLLDVDDSLGVCSESVDFSSGPFESESSITKNLWGIGFRRKEEENKSLTIRMPHNTYFLAPLTKIPQKMAKNPSTHLHPLVRPINPPLMGPRAGPRKGAAAKNAIPIPLCFWSRTSAIVPPAFESGEDPNKPERHLKTRTWAIFCDAQVTAVHIVSIT